MIHGIRRWEGMQILWIVCKIYKNITDMQKFCFIINLTAITKDPLDLDIFGISQRSVPTHWYICGPLPCT
jgi:hypothetical protein